MTPADPIQEYLNKLTPLARGNLLTELERLEACGKALGIQLDQQGGLEHVHGRSGQGRSDDHLDAFDLVGPCTADRGLEHRLQGRRGSVMNDQQPGHVRRA